MKKFIETIKNIWKIEDLRSRIIYTLGIILIYRLGTHIVLPGIDPVIISNMANRRQPGGGHSRSAEPLYRWSLCKGLHFRTGNYALHLCIHCGTAAGYCSSLFPEAAA